MELAFFGRFPHPKGIMIRKKIDDDDATIRIAGFLSNPR
jgi:hypothetical protein